MRNGISKSKTEWIVLWIIPALAIMLGAYFWLTIQKQTDYFLFLFLFPMMFSFMLPSVSMRVFKFWKWKINDLHLALVWAGYVQLTVFVTAGLVTSEPNVFNLLHHTFSFAVCLCAFCVLVDVSCLHDGLLEVYNRAHFKNLGTVNSVNSYAYFFFMVIGILFGMVTKLGYEKIVVEGGQNIFSLALIAAAVSALPHLVRFYQLHLKLKAKAH